MFVCLFVYLLLLNNAHFGVCEWRFKPSSQVCPLSTAFQEYSHKTHCKHVVAFSGKLPNEATVSSLLLNYFTISCLNNNVVHRGCWTVPGSQDWHWISHGGPLAWGRAVRPPASAPAPFCFTIGLCRPGHCCCPVALWRRKWVLSGFCVSALSLVLL